MLNGDVDSVQVSSNYPIIDLVKGFELELEKCFKLHPDLNLNDTSDCLTGAQQAQHTSSCLRLVLDFLPPIDPFDWRSSALFREYINSLNLDTNQVDNLKFDLSEEEDELIFAFDHHSLITSQLPDAYDDEDEPIKTADEVIREIDIIMGRDDDLLFPSVGDQCSFTDLVLSGETLEATTISETDLETLSLNQLNSLLEELEACVREYSAILVQELAYREELDFEQEQKDIFIARLDEMHRRLERRRRRASMPPINRSGHPTSCADATEPFEQQNKEGNCQSTNLNHERQMHDSPGRANFQAPVFSRAQSAAHAAVAAASSATALLKRQWHRLSRGPDELAGVDVSKASQEPTYTDQRKGASGVYTGWSSDAFFDKPSAHPSAHTSRAATIVRLRKWASRKASEALNSGASGSFRALLRRTAKNVDAVGPTPPCIREARSAVTTPTSSQIELPTIPSTLTHSASGHLVGNHELNADIMEYKNLTTTIPYHHSIDGLGPTVEQLQVFNEMLLAILTNNPNVTPMLTDYILNVYAPADDRPSKLPI